ncbi:Glu/Leu/Phe/Val dehydrogenase dimerization domain-containing protein [Aureibacter tunicatorum]|uniref:Leucine dehydrogenase n=1 Tax=Aureibacter tunicatorum TaxID=866807 RepID=A0AAE3XLG6_9BACT|nr:Glu/Leu/Phe/Val dehydrogenase dimerization domain-containing protein [Aureibacter tunicatorum]MDR6238627.1 leucine dehydrogenase [Aureibacter tunicatorum]BDD05442.1 leucine dehydrogenase [Aureibacter tunicatorum]
MNTENISVFELAGEMGHEQVVYCHDEYTGLKAIIGIHNTSLGPALGGTRMWHYATEQEALNDVLRLSRGMTFKAAISGLNLGGGKAVIIGDAKALKSEALLRRFGKFVDSLSGKYITAEDVNMTTKDMEYISMETSHVTGLSESLGGGGDPSPVTAYGSYMGMKAAAKFAFGNDDLKDKKIAVQGVGNVGTHLVEYLVKENAKVYITDIYDDKLQKVALQYGVDVVGMDEVYDLDMDIYAPCALGATINDDTLSRLKCSVIAGAANNQLADENKHGLKLIEKGITYAPDFLINAGGLINVGMDYLGPYNRDRVFEHTQGIYDTCLDILKDAQTRNITAQEAAMDAAIKRINDAKERQGRM